MPSIRAHYGPNNTVLTLVGDITPEEGLRRCGEYFGPLPPIELAPARAACRSCRPSPSPCGSTASATCPTTASTSPSACPSTRRPTTSPAQVAVDVLGGLASSRLMRRLVRTDETAVAVGGWTMGLVDGVGLGDLHRRRRRPAPTPKRSRQALCEEIERFVAEGPDEAELESVIADTERSWLSALASIEERADHISHHALLTGDPAYVNTFVDRLESVSADAGPGRGRGVARPGLAGRRALPRRHEWSRRGGGGRMTARRPPRRRARREPWDFPEASTHDLPNGLRLRHLRRARPVRHLACVSACPSRCATSRATARAWPRSWRGPSTRGRRSTPPRSSPGCSSARASASGRGWPTPASPSTSTSSRATSSRPSTCCGRSSPSPPSRRPRSPGRCARGWPRSTRSESVPAAPRRARVGRAPSTPPRTGRPAPPADRGRRCSRSRGTTSWLSMRSTSSRPGRRSSSLVTSTGLDVPRPRRGGARRLGRAVAGTAPASSTPGRDTRRATAAASSSSSAPARCRPRSSSALPGQTAPSRVAGPRTRCIGFVLGGSPNARVDAVLREEKGYTYGIRSSFRPRRTGGVFLTSGSVRADSHGGVAAAARRDPRERAGRVLGEGDPVRRRLHRQDRPGRYATADAMADEAISMALDGRTTEFMTEQPARPAHASTAAGVDDGIRAIRRRRRHRRPGQSAGGGWTIVLVGDADAHLEAIEALGLGECRRARRPGVTPARSGRTPSR